MAKYQNKPLMFVLSSLDEFMMPWNTYYFWRDFSIQTNNMAFMRRLTNTDHYLGGKMNEVVSTLTNFVGLVSKVISVSYSILNEVFLYLVEITLV